MFQGKGCSLRKTKEEEDKDTKATT